MKFSEFEKVLTAPRLGRYVRACHGNTRKAMVLYRLNLKISQEMFTVISCFEVALRNAIDLHCCVRFGQDWLRDSALPGGVFDNDYNCRFTKTAIEEAIGKLKWHYTPDKLVAELGFGFWRYQFAAHQYRATGRTLLHIFPGKPSSSKSVQYNSTYVFNQLARINDLRNRIAHHEPICFLRGTATKSSQAIRADYAAICELLHWMELDVTRLLFGMNHIETCCQRLDAL
jgi:hypothetical protein